MQKCYFYRLQTGIQNERTQLKLKIITKKWYFNQANNYKYSFKCKKEPSISSKKSVIEV